MANSIPEIKVTDFVSFVTAVESTRSSLGAGELWYRGISRSSYKLVPSLFRHPTCSNIDAIDEMERRIFRDFSFRSPSFDKTHRDEWDLLFLMQHYRSPTRLLDWTSSPLVALFFAASHAQNTGEPAVVWVMNPAEWNSGVLEEIGQDPIIFNTKDDILEVYHPLSKLKGRSQPLAMEGIINNPRINAQKGKFVIFGRQLKSMEDFATSQPNWKVSMPFAKIVCEASTIPDIAIALGNYGITQTSIYPDLEGLAVEIKLRAGYPHV